MRWAWELGWWVLSPREHLVSAQLAQCPDLGHSESTAVPSVPRAPGRYGSWQWCAQALPGPGPMGRLAGQRCCCPI